MKDQKRVSDIKDMAREELLGFLDDAVMNWLAHDGLWFQSTGAHGNLPLKKVG